jgi:hypothetical protein
MDGFPQMGCDNDHLGASTPLDAPPTPSPQFCNLRVNQEYLLFLNNINDSDIIQCE